MINKLIIASNNKNKIKEIKEILAGRFEEILSMAEAGLDMDIEENGTTFADNAKIKAYAVMQQTGCAALADDSGLEVYALDGRPGVYSARYCGHHGDDDANNKKLLEDMRCVPDGQRGGRYVCAIALIMPDGTEYVAEGDCPGEILREERGNGGFGYDPLFYMLAFNATMAEISSELKNTISHRKIALTGLEKLLAAADSK